MNLTHEHYGELISLALLDRASWIPARPSEAAKRRKLHLYNRVTLMADLLGARLVSFTPSKGGQTYAVRLTEAGKAAILAMPDDLHDEWFPLPRDIAAAKARVKG